MKTTDYLSLDKSATKEISNELQNLLADFQVYYTNLRGFHWNIKGPRFFKLHDKFEELYDEVSDQIDEIAERILMLGETPLHNFSDYLKKNEIKESGVVANGDEAMKLVLGYLKTLIAKERKILDIASEANDEGTVSLMGDYILGQEKTVWMLASTLS
ncbi:MAG: DNA starvation/stationary phase protection protein [Dysgonamonadaceae bacterium]|nr:DNA starvation/stationary phase protection protein [Dysgonamonadaceae bacterium]MDD4727948.1 DNA starvation/stationary phase protection protein [Dysgonamonadaceae bacterium]